MEVEVFVGNVVAQISYNPGFDGAGCGASFVDGGGGGKYVKAARMREA